MTMVRHRLGLALSLWYAAAPVALTAQNFDTVQVRAVPVASGVHMLLGAGGNIGVSAGDDGVFLVDDQYAPLTERIRAAVARISGQPLRFVLNTHWHGDHTGGNAHFGGKEASIVAHSNVRKRLAGRSDLRREALPVITFDQSASVHFNGEEIKLLHHGPGHTDGDSIIHFSSANVVHMGDQFFNGRFPYIDLGSGGDVEGFVKTVDAVLQKIPADAKVIPGHGPLGNVDDLKKFREMLVETTGLVKKAIAEGKTLDQVKAAGLPEKWKEWGTGFINTSRWLEISYNSLKK